MPKTMLMYETALYHTLLQMSHYDKQANEWLKRLPNWLASIKDKSRYAHAPFYESVISKLPVLPMHSADLNGKEVTAVVDFELTDFKKTEALLKHLMPWRKGGFCIGQGKRTIHIDTEWRSDLKWERIAPFISDLTGRRVLDVGGGSGYHGFRMVGAGATTVIVIDPSCLFYHQFMAIRHFLDGISNRYAESPIHFIPVGLEELPRVEQGGLFDTVFCMGVLYHRASPFECLWQLKDQLKKGGELVLETLVVDGDENTVLVPKGRYAMMNNVYFLPSVDALMLWLTKAGFVNIRCVDLNETTTDEQRTTEWMTYHSLTDFLHPNDPTKTIEGYPRPKRAVVVANRPSK
ncbi:MAG: tRNA 5-methoxyuridine(34)/uridine 5-oxyacetic acid(34) synthase CmoB [Moraxella sp.]|nr:tRNA 5-methoxyuridine(34)/uridine 5-oxyacetic acid(34) synthase CmoB [Moraxella sp.]